MITVEEARNLLFDLVEPLPAEPVSLAHASGRVLAQDVAATRDQPPFAASSMDGYAVKSAEVELHAMFKVIGEAAAGRRFDGVVGAGQAVRIFTGAPVPEGADFVVIQEDVERRGDLITITDAPDGTKTNIRPAGIDFSRRYEDHGPPADPGGRCCFDGGNEHPRCSGDAQTGGRIDLNRGRIGDARRNARPGSDHRVQHLWLARPC